MRLKSYQILIFFGLLTMLSCEEFDWDLKEKPLIEKVEIQAVDTTSCEVVVELKYINSQNIGLEDEVELQLYIDTNELAQIILVIDNPSLGLNKFSISDLQTNTNYYLKVAARNKVGETRSSFIYFQTLNTAGLPTISTLGSSTITSNSAFLSGNLSNAGSSAISSKGFCYSTSANPTISNNVVNVSGGSLGNFSAIINGLSSNTVYYFRAFATNSSGVAYGNPMQFQTSNTVQQIPTVSTLGSSSITSNSAFLSGNLSNTGSSSISSKGFCYSTSANPTISNNVVNVSGGSLGNFSTSINGLSSNTIYYFRAFATNSSGVAYGNPMQFQTITPLFVGQTYQGGIIAYLDGTGIHGLIAAPIDQSDSQWGCYGNQIPGADANCFGCGEQNTADILNNCNNVYSAAYACNALVLGGYSDWYLPSLWELNKLYENRQLIGGFQTTEVVVADCWYWSSTEWDANYGRFVNFSNGFNGNFYKNNSINVRAVRKF
jgi:hypothetical protein